MPLDRFNDRVRSLAHDLWEREGKPHGRNDEFWSRAYDEVTTLAERDDAIRVEAYRMWTQAGRPLWTADRFWFAAEEAVGSTQSGTRV